MSYHFDYQLPHVSLSLFAWGKSDKTAIKQEPRGRLFTLVFMLTMLG